MVLWKVYGKARPRHHGGLQRLRFAQVVSKAQVIASQLLVGFSDDRRFFVQLLVLLVFFVLVIIVGMSRRHSVTAHDGDETPNVVRDTWLSFSAPLWMSRFMAMLARVLAPAKASALLSLQYRRL
jgi:hypothetical protein